jgi:hypothetical protein
VLKDLQFFSAWLEFARERAIVALAFALAGVNPAASQPGRGAADEQPRAAEQSIEEITVIGHRYLRELRLEVQASRERVYNLFNDLNINEEFDIHCHDGSRTGTRTVRRVCRPQYVDVATSEAAKWYLVFMKWGRGGAFSRAQAEISVVHLKARQMDAEVERLMGESREFRRAIAEYQALEGRYDAARRGVAIQAFASIVDTVGAAPWGDMPRRTASTAPAPVDLATTGLPPSREGWVKLRYSVRADGRTAEVRAVDTMPPGLDPSAAVAAAETWTFEPATEGRAPIDWHNNLAVVSFGRPEIEYGGSLQFAEAYEGVAELIAGGRLEDAKSRNEQMQRVHAETLEELQLAQLQLAAIEHALGRPHAALAAIRRATEQGVAGLQEEELKIALEHRFTLELELGYAADALRTYERRAAIERLPPREPLAQQAAALEQALAAPGATQAVQGLIAETGDWEHALPVSAFEVGGVQGNVDGLAVECHRNKTELPFQPNAEVTIPATWGGCVVTVRGQPDTTFTLYEFH